MAFLDPTMPIATCRESDCVGCSVADSMTCHFRPMQLVQFLLISLPSFLLGGAALLASGWLPLVVWIAVCLGFFGALEIRVLCSHCPHYAEEGSTLKCWANHGSPKFFKYRPGPLSKAETFWLIAGLVAMWGIPVPFFVIGGMWFLLGVYALVTAGFFVTVKMFLCPQCMNFACPANSVPEKARAAFFARNPVVAAAWKETLSA